MRIEEIFSLMVFVILITFIVFVAIRQYRKYVQTIKFMDFIDSIPPSTIQATMADRNNITPMHRYVGMRIFVVETEKWYRLDDNLKTWTEIQWPFKDKYLASDGIN